MTRRPSIALPDALVRDLWRMNPWWEGGALPKLPPTRRYLVDQIHRRLQLRLAPAVVVRGPRQIGKTTAQLQVVRDLLDQGVPPRNLFRVQADDLSDLKEISEPILRFADWYEQEILGKSLNDAAQEGASTYLFLDEIQNLKDWAPQLKSLVDHSTTQVVVTGSSALRIERGRDSLAGRISTIEAGALSLTEIAAFRGIGLGPPFLPDNGLEPLARRELWLDLREHGRGLAKPRDDAFRAFSERGGYPLVHQLVEAPWSYLADQLNETVIKRVVRHDLRSRRRQDAALLEQVFLLACRYAGQAPGPHLLARESQRVLGSEVSPRRAQQALRLLADSLLLRLVEPLELRLKKTRGNAKICLADHGLRASWLQEIVPLDPVALEQEPHLTTLAGRIAESVTGAALSTISHLDLAHLPARSDQPEVDFILTIGTKRIPLEVKYQKKLDPLQDTEGLRRFIEKAANNAPFGILVSQIDGDSVVDPRIVTLPLSSLMLLR